MKYLCQTCKPCDYLKKFEEEMAKKEQVNVTLLYVWLVFPWTQFEWFCSFLTKNFPSLQFACREGGTITSPHGRGPLLVIWNVL